MMFTKEWFFDLERRLRDAGLDSDEKSFDEIREILTNPRNLSPEEFASACAYVILAGGFSQKTAKKKHAAIVFSLQSSEFSFDSLFSIFHNKNKINAILKIWQNRAAYRDGYYKIGTRNRNEEQERGTGTRNEEQKLSYLQKLPHIGKITANHLARNLGENVVKYDIWIQRLGVVFVKEQERGTGTGGIESKINNGALDPDVKKACDEMFARLEKETGLPRGYIDVVLWKACQNKLIELKE